MLIVIYSPSVKIFCFLFNCVSVANVSPLINSNCPLFTSALVIVLPVPVVVMLDNTYDLFVINVPLLSVSNEVITFPTPLFEILLNKLLSVEIILSFEIIILLPDVNFSCLDSIPSIIEE